MRRFLRLIVLMAVFLGGYYVGHLPNSPDIVAWSANAYRRVDKATKDIAARSKAENTSVPEAAVSYLFGSAVDSQAAED